MTTPLLSRCVKNGYIEFLLLDNKIGNGLVLLNEKKYPLILSCSKNLKRLQINCIFLYCFITNAEKKHPKIKRFAI